LLASGACHESVIHILTASEDRRKLVAASALRLWWRRSVVRICCHSAVKCPPPEKAERMSSEYALADHALLQNFVLEVSDALRSMTDAAEIQGTTSRMLGERLGAARVFYAEIAEGPLAVVDRDYASGLPSLGGQRLPLADYGEELIGTLRRGGPLLIEDVAHEPRLTRDARAALLALGVTAAMITSLVKDGCWVALFAVHDTAPRHWTATDVAMLDEIAERTWAAVERAGAQAAAARDLRDTRLLRDLAARLVVEDKQQAFHDEILDAAISLADADAGTVQMLDHPGGDLLILATRGFSAETVRYFARVTAASGTSCGIALASGRRAFVDFDDPAHADDPAMRLHVQDGYCSAQSTPLVTRAGRPIGMLSTHWRASGHRPTDRQLRFLDLLARQAADLLERHEAEAALRRSERDLREADRRKNEFLAVLAHELRNPLAPVRTGLELIRLAGDSREAVERVRGMMERQVGQMVRLIDDLLDVSRISSGKIRLQREISPLAPLVHGAVEANRAAIDTAHLELALDLPATMVWIDVDTTRFVQVLSNILQNAVKFTPEGGRILIEGRLAKRPHDGVEVLTISVSDSGVGISEDMIGRVFELFTQDDAAAGRSHSGLGIGLALARRLMELHGGTVDVYSDGPGHGSRFTVRIPVARHVEPLAARVARQRRAAIGQKVLVIDDNLDAANTVALLVESLGNACEVAYDGETGLARALALRPSVILLDIGMPGMDGYQTCRQLRSALGPDVVIVAVTGWGQEQDKDDAYRAGFSAHLTKPADPAALEHLLARGEEPYEPAS